MEFIFELDQLEYLSSLKNYLAMLGSMNDFVVSRNKFVD